MMGCPLATSGRQGLFRHCLLIDRDQGGRAVPSKPDIWPRSFVSNGGGMLFDATLCGSIVDGRQSPATPPFVMVVRLHGTVF